MFNQVTLIGNLGTDIELRYTKDNQPIANFRMATSRRWKKGDEWVTATEWHRVKIWGKRAEWAERDLSKGDLVTVVGRLETQKWEDKTGAQRYTTEVIALTLGYPRTEHGSSETAQDSPARAGKTQPTSQPAAGFNDDDIPF